MSQGALQHFIMAARMTPCTKLIALPPKLTELEAEGALHQLQHSSCEPSAVATASSCCSRTQGEQCRHATGAANSRKNELPALRDPACSYLGAGASRSATATMGIGRQKSTMSDQLPILMNVNRAQSQHLRLKTP